MVETLRAAGQTHIVYVGFVETRLYNRQRERANRGRYSDFKLHNSLRTEDLLYPADSARFFDIDQDYGTVSS